METPEHHERIDSVQGNYIIARSRDFETLIDKSNVAVGNTVLVVGQKTTLHGWFKAEIEYCGMLEGNKMIFYLGTDYGTIFDEGFHYYDVTYRITHQRIGKSYKPGTFRDRFLRYKNGNVIWK